jgi:hypothetical protein
MGVQLEKPRTWQKPAWCMFSRNCGEDMDNSSKGMPKSIDAFHEMLEQERKRLAFRPSRMQKLVYRNRLQIENEIMNARRYDLAIRLHI